MKKYFNTYERAGFGGYPVVGYDTVTQKGFALGRAAHTDLSYTQTDIETWLTSYSFPMITAADVVRLTGRKLQNDTRHNHLSQRRVKGRFAPSKPKELRKGSLYKAESTDGKQIVGRYRNDAFGSFLVFSEHKNPVIVKADTVKFADMREVNTYLGK